MADPFRVAPLGGSEGCTFPRPWHSRVTVAIPHLDTLEILPTALALWRLQTVRPYLLVVDTGSPPEVCDTLEALRAADLEIHFLRSHGYRHPSAPVTAALDLAQTLCTTEHLVHTHADVFPRHRNLLNFLLTLTDHRQPVVGWRMSPRPSSTAPSKDEWQTAVSHTCTCLHMPTVHCAGLTWAMERYFAWRPGERERSAAWPDTESAFALAMHEQGIWPTLLGDEENLVRHGNEWWDHARSYTGLKATGISGHLQNALLFARAKGYTEDALREARERLEVWRVEAGQQEQPE